MKTDGLLSPAPIDGKDGNDAINGKGGDDAINGKDGDDIIDGGSGNDEIFGRRGNDTIDGDDGSDSATGGAGDDTIRGGDGQDKLLGGDDALEPGAPRFEARGGAQPGRDDERRARLGEMLDRVLPVEDDEIAKAARRSFEKRGIAIHTSASVASLESPAERPCPVRPSTSARRMISSPSSRSFGGSKRTKLVRFRKSSTPSGEKKRAVPPVGNTWLGPAM